MAIFLRVVAYVARYGQRAVNFVWRNKKKILDMVLRGLGIDAIIRWVERQLGIK